jgi:hypothetical protein
MHRVTSASIVALSWLMVSPAAAQQGTPSDPPAEAAQSAVVIMVSPNQAAPTHDYLQYELEEATERSRRVRVALISTSAVFGVGIVLAGIGASQCQVIQRFNQDELLCNTAGDVLLPLGGAFIAAGAIGMITSGIMLGVRNKQKREIERDMRRRYYGGRLQWDIPSGRLVF